MGTSMRFAIRFAREILFVFAIVALGALYAWAEGQIDGPYFDGGSTATVNDTSGAVLVDASKGGNGDSALTTIGNSSGETHMLVLSNQNGSAAWVVKGGGAAISNRSLRVDGEMSGTVNLTTGELTALTDHLLDDDDTGGTNSNMVQIGQDVHTGLIIKSGVACGTCDTGPRQDGGAAIILTDRSEIYGWMIQADGSMYWADTGTTTTSTSDDGGVSGDAEMDVILSRQVTNDYEYLDLTFDNDGFQDSFPIRPGGHVEWPVGAANENTFDADDCLRHIGSPNASMQVCDGSVGTGVDHSHFFGGTGPLFIRTFGCHIDDSQLDATESVTFELVTLDSDYANLTQRATATIAGSDADGYDIDTDLVDTQLTVGYLVVRVDAESFNDDGNTIRGMCWADIQQ